METKRELKQHLGNFHIAGFTYYDGALVFRKLKIGKPLKLQLEEDNKYDSRAVAIYYKRHKIGYVPRSENRIFYKLLKVGLESHAQILVQQKNAHADPESQVRVVCFLQNFEAT